MESIEQITGLAISIYADYCNRGFSPDVAKEKAIKEVSECDEGIEIRNTWDSSLMPK